MTEPVGVFNNEPIGSLLMPHKFEIKPRLSAHQRYGEAVSHSISKSHLLPKAVTC